MIRPQAQIVGTHNFEEAARSFLVAQARSVPRLRLSRVATSCCRTYRSEAQLSRIFLYVFQFQSHAELSCFALLL